MLADARIRRENAEAQANSSVISEQATDSVSTDTQAIEESVETSTEEIPARESTDEDSGTAEAVTNENPAEVSVATDSLTDEENTDDLPVVTEHTEFLTDDAAINEDESVAISEESDDQATDETVSEPVAEENAEQTAVSEEETEQISFEFDEESDESAAEVTEVTKEAEKPRRDLDKYDPEKPRGVDSVFEFLELFAFTLVAVMLLTTFFFRYSRVDGGSMDKTLADGDHLLISNFMYTPERGDIIVFEDYGTELYEPLVKRVIGVAGDTVEVTITGDVIVNGELLDEPYVYVTPGRHPTMIHGKWYVEEGEVFVLGDHRDVSKDSREFGPIRADSILGEAKLRFYPFDKFGGLD